MLCWLPVFVLHLSLCSAACIFDDIKPAHPTRSFLQYTHTLIDDHQEEIEFTPEEIIRDKRSNAKYSSDGYSPIRIKTQFFDIEDQLLPNHQQKLKRILNRAVEKVKKLFSVIPVSGPLLLSRSAEACQLVINGKNITNNGKCAKIHPGYVGETCIDHFKIPDDHLEGLNVYSENNPEPVDSIPPGKGIPDTDFVLYVKSMSTAECVREGVAIIAYAAYCQVDQYDRPVAGYINFCPSLIRSTDYDEERIYLTALHELFHALGFSATLFDRFKACEVSGSAGAGAGAGAGGSNYVCEAQPGSGVRRVLDAQRLVARRVVQLTAAHYDCRGMYADQFGPILQTSTSGRVRSHWDAAFLQGSLMTPTIGLPHLTFLDPITLAFFEDTGWYKVDYSQADLYKWGKGEGCDFGLFPKCAEAGRCFCEELDESGCHFLLVDKGTCVTDSFLHDCLIFKPQVNCETKEGIEGEVTEAVGERYKKDSRCFISNITNEDSGDAGAMEGRCFEHRCDDEGGLQMRVGEAPWQACPYGEAVQVPGYQGVVRCPEAGRLCVDEDIPTPEPEAEPSSSTTTKTVTVSMSVPGYEEEEVCVEVVFWGAEYGALERAGRLRGFEAACVRRVVQLGGVAEHRIHNALLYDGSVHFQFDLLPPSADSPTEPSTSAVLRLLTEAVHSGTFQVTLEEEVFVASSIKEIMDIPVVSDKGTNLGAIIGGTVASLIGVALVVLGILLGQRCYLFYQLRQPQLAQLRQARRGRGRGRQGQAPPPPRTLSVTSHGGGRSEGVGAYPGGYPEGYPEGVGVLSVPPSSGRRPRPPQLSRILVSSPPPSRSPDVCSQSRAPVSAARSVNTAAVLYRNHANVDRSQRRHNPNRPVQSHADRSNYQLDARIDGATRRPATRGGERGGGREKERGKEGERGREIGDGAEREDSCSVKKPSRCHHRELHRTSSGVIRVTPATLDIDHESAPFREPKRLSRIDLETCHNRDLTHDFTRDFPNASNQESHKRKTLPRTDLRDLTVESGRHFHHYPPPVRPLSAGCPNESLPPNLGNLATPTHGYMVSSSSLNSEIPIHRLSVTSQQSGLSMRDVYLREHGAGGHSNRTSFSSDTSQCDDDDDDDDTITSAHSQ